MTNEEQMNHEALLSTITNLGRGFEALIDQFQRELALVECDRDDALARLRAAGLPSPDEDDGDEGIILAQARARRAAVEFRLSPRTPGYAMGRLGEAFPSLVGVSGVNPWDPHALAQWLFGGNRSLQTLDAGLFLLGLWNVGHFNERLPTSPKWDRFSMYPALGVWDAAHRSAFLTWVQNPWWP